MTESLFCNAKSLMVDQREQECRKLLSSFICVKGQSERKQGVKLKTHVGVASTVTPADSLQTPPAQRLLILKQRGGLKSGPRGGKKTKNYSKTLKAAFQKAKLRTTIELENKTKLHNGKVKMEKEVISEEGPKRDFIFSSAKDKSRFESGLFLLLDDK